MSRLGLKVLALALALGGGGSGSVVAQPGNPQWIKRYPDLLPNAGAPEYSVGVATTSSHLYAAGLAKRLGVYQFCLTKHDFASGAIVAEQYWPPTTHGDPNLRTVVDMVSFTSLTTDTGSFWLAGHQPDVNGTQRTSVVMFQTTGVPQYPLSIPWGQTEDIGESAEERPVGIALRLTTAPPEPAPDVLSVAASSVEGANRSVVVRAYMAVSGKRIWTLKWSANNTSNDDPVGVSMAADAVIVSGTTNGQPTLGGTHKRLFVLALEKETGAHLPGSPLFFEPLAGQEFDAVAQATAVIESQGTQSFTAVAATRTTLSTGNQAATVHTCAIIDDPTRQLVARWSDGWDGSLPLTDPTPINRATSVHVAGFTPTDQITANFRVWLGGTVQTNSEAATGLLVVQFDDQPDPNPRREWWDIWRRNVLGANNVPLAIRFSENNSESKRIYVVGKTQNAGGDYDMVTIKYDTAAEIGGGNKPPLWGDNGNPILNNISAFGDDVGVAVHPRPNMQGDPMNFFITGPSFGGSTANDWLTARYQESP